MLLYACYNASRSVRSVVSCRFPTYQYIVEITVVLTTISKRVKNVDAVPDQLICDHNPGKSITTLGSQKIIAHEDPMAQVAWLLVRYDFRRGSAITRSPFFYFACGVC